MFGEMPLRGPTAKGTPLPIVVSSAPWGGIMDSLRRSGIASHGGGMVVEDRASVASYPRTGTREVHGGTTGATLQAWGNVSIENRKSNPELLKFKFFETSEVDGLKSSICPDGEINRNVEQWSSTIVGFVLERRPYYVNLKRDLLRQWKPVGSLDVYSRENGIFLFKFSLEDDCARVLEEGPWTHDNRSS